MEDEIDTKKLDINDYLSGSGHFIEDFDIVFKGICENCLEA